MLVDRRNKSSITNVRSIRGAECGSDHHLVLVKLIQRISLETKKKCNGTDIFAIEKLRETNVVKHFQISLTNRFQVLSELRDSNEETQEIDEMWEDLKKITTEAVKEVCGKRKKRKKNPWFDKKCEQVLQDRRSKKKNG